jgi:carboxyl-terminal processing protease
MMLPRTPLTILIALTGSAFWGCQFQPVSVSLAESQTAYSVSSTGTGFRLDTRIPVAPYDLQAGISTYSGPEYTPGENPPGEAVGAWIRQNTWYYPQSWGDHEEFWYGWMLLDLFSVDRSRHVSPTGLESQGVQALFRAFQSDKFTAYYPPEVADALGDALSGTESDSVFGIFFRAWPRDTLVAAQVEQGSAAWNAGIRADDRLLRFDGRWASGSLAYLYDTAGHRAVEIEYLHPSADASTTVRISRSPIVMKSLYRDTLPGAVGYLAIGQFVSTDGLATDSLFQDAAAWLELHSKGRWILDLRGNGGGTIETARRIASALLANHTDLMRIQERDYDQRTLEGLDVVDTMRTDDSVTRRLSNRPIYLLQDRYTASSSEILLSSLRENLGSSLETFGDTSYGKGIGQIYVSTPLDGFMAVTCLHLDPMRASRYHGVGIPPDNYLASADSTIDRAWKLARPSAAARTAGAIAENRPNLAALEWNRREISRRVTAPLYPSGPGRPFPVH